MPRFFVANLNFEQELAGDRQTLPVDLADRAAELAACWLPETRDGDCIWCPRPVPQAFWQEMSALGLPLIKGISALSDIPAGLQLAPWGWSDVMQQFARRSGARTDGPPQAAVTEANSRRFSFELERRWDVGLRRAQEVTSPAELEQAVGSVGADERWVLKSEFSSAARQRIVCTGPVPDSAASGWIRKRLAAGEWVLFEPWVNRISEVGLQWTVPQSGPPVLAGVTELHTDSLGQYCGSGFGLAADALAGWQSAIEIARRAVEVIQQLGYFGPVGIDSMRYRDAEGVERIRPLQDINARWTMGRLALGWQRIMPRGVWRLGTVDEFSQQQRAVPNIVRTSPESTGERSARIATWLEQPAHDSGVQTLPADA